MDGQTALIKQCMPVNEPIVVEKLTEDDVKETLNPGSETLDQTARFYPGKVIKFSVLTEAKSTDNSRNSRLTL